MSKINRARTRVNEILETETEEQLTTANRFQHFPTEHRSPMSSKPTALITEEK